MHFFKTERTISTKLARMVLNVFCLENGACQNVKTGALPLALSQQPIWKTFFPNKIMKY